MSQSQAADRRDVEGRRGGKTRAGVSLAEQTGASKWLALSHEWERSGVSQVEFCQQRGLAVASLRWWRWRLGTRARQSGSRVQLVPVASRSPAPFVPVEVIGEAVSHLPAARLATVDIVLRRGRRVRVGADFDALLLARIVKVLEAIP